MQMANTTVRKFRYAIGRWLIHMGLKVMPRGRVRSELTAILTQWGESVISSNLESAMEN